MPIRWKALILALVELTGGFLLALVLLEVVLRADPGLLPRGTGAFLPIDAPLQDRTFTVRFSDADIFYWQASLVRPPADDRPEAVVHWRTDEFGFPNPAPIPAAADIVLLGRSYSMGAQAEDPWPELLRGQGFSVFNLAQTGAGIDQKLDYFRRFGLPRHPGYVVVDVLPPMDFLECPHTEPFLVSRALFPFAQTLLRKWIPQEAAPRNSGIYPLPMGTVDRPLDAVFFSYYLSALSLGKSDWASDHCWTEYQAGLNSLIAEARQNGVIPILLFVPTKESVLVPMSDFPGALIPALATAGSWRLDGGTAVASSIPSTPETVRENAGAARSLVADFAVKRSLCLVDPSDDFTESLEAEISPFMVYDTHWSAIGHQIVAADILAAIRNGGCR